MRALIVVFAGLMALSGVTFGLSFVHTGSLAIPSAVAIAAAKASLIFWHFMDVRDHRSSSRIALVTAIAMVAVLVVFTALDVATRDPLAATAPAATAESAEPPAEAPPAR